MFNSHISTQGLTKSLTEKIEALDYRNTNQSRDTFYHHYDIGNWLRIKVSDLCEAKDK